MTSDELVSDAMAQVALASVLLAQALETLECLCPGRSPLGGAEEPPQAAPEASWRPGEAGPLDLIEANSAVAAVQNARHRSAILHYWGDV